MKRGANSIGPAVMAMNPPPMTIAVHPARAIAAASRAPEK